jgi:enterochelin esterase-like enzyme
MALPSVIEDSLVFTLDDPDRTMARVGLDCDDAVAGRRRFRRTATGWLLSIPRPELNRLEYRLVVTSRTGDTTVVCDPENPERVPTAFGDRSVALMPGYERPGWLRADAEPGTMTKHVSEDIETDTDTDTDTNGVGEIPITIWSPPGLAPDEPAHLLVVHDGPEYVELAQLDRYASVVVATGTVPPFRMALMHPVERDAWYAANESYLAAELAALEELTNEVPVVGEMVVMGASLGGLTALLVALAARPRFGGLLSQSGSFFNRDLDSQESSYPQFQRVTDAVRSVVTGPVTDSPLQVVMTCGRMEENFANNDAMSSALAELGHLVAFTPLPDLHNYTAWRDALDPALTEVLRTVWSRSRMNE